MMLHQYRLGLDDARKAVALDRSFARGYIRIAKCSLALGRLTEANTAFSAVRGLSLTNSAIVPEVNKLDAVIASYAEGKKAYLEQDYRKCIFCTDKILKYVPCARYKLQKAACLAFLGRFQNAQDIASDVLHIDEHNAGAFHIRGWCSYYQGNIKAALSQFQNALRLQPDYKEAWDHQQRAKTLLQKMEEGNKAYNEGRFSEAYGTYTEALKIDPENNPVKIKLLFNKALACQRMSRLTETVADCTSVLELNRNCLKALLLRAQCYMDLGDFDKAVGDFKSAFEMDRSPDNMRRVEHAQLALIRSQHKDYYSTSGADRNATADEMKKAYRRKALIHDPDRHVNESEVDRKKRREEV
jgi:DnaJ family protein C protein 7